MRQTAATARLALIFVSVKNSPSNSATLHSGHPIPAQMLLLLTNGHSCDVAYVERRRSRSRSRCSRSFSGRDVPYAFSDDYPLLWMAVSGEPSRSSVRDRRRRSDQRTAVAGLSIEWSFSAAGTIDNLRFVRLGAILGIVALGLLLHWALVRSKVNLSSRR